MHEKLKIKIKSLAAEAQMIHHQERKMHGPKWGTSTVRYELRSHRLIALRPDARVAQLAYGFLRGRSYGDLETNARSQPNWEEAGRLVSKFAEPHDASEERLDLRVVLQQFAAWRDGAHDVIVANTKRYHEEQPDRAARNALRRANHKSRTLSDWLDICDRANAGLD